MSSTPPDFRALFEAVPGMYLVLSPELVILVATDRYLAATMTTREHIIGRGLFEVFPDNPGDTEATGAENLAASLARVLAVGRPDTMAVQKYDVRKPEAEGGAFEERYWSPINTPVFGDDGRVRYIIHCVEDVTEFVRLEALELEKRDLNEALRSRTGRMEAEIRQRAREVEDANRELRALHDDLERRVDARTRELMHANEALRVSEAQLRQSQKLEAVGRLAGGVAHDFNNLLSIVLTYSEFLLDEIEPSSPLRGDIEEIKKAGVRASELTRRMLAFSRQQMLDPKIIDLNEVVSGLSSMLGRVLGEDVKLVTSLPDTLGKVKADPGQIEQVLMNLVVNARDAMPNGGLLSIETSNVFLDAAYAGAHLEVVPGPHVMLAVSDTGAGMDKDTVARIFEPFFTTKSPGKGTGLGLATVFGIVKQSKGNLWVYSEPGRGTTFKIYFPVAEGEVERVEDAPRVAPRGDETILVMEDEAQVRVAVYEILRKAGYDVLVVNSPDEAITLSEKRDAPIHLLLTDVVMPGMNGRELSDVFATRCPDAKVLFMSGYTDDVILHHGVLEAGVPFLQKPVTPMGLSRKVREVLDAPRRM